MCTTYSLGLGGREQVVEAGGRRGRGGGGGQGVEAGVTECKSWWERNYFLRYLGSSSIFQAWFVTQNVFFSGSAAIFDNNVRGETILNFFSGGAW